MFRASQMATATRSPTGAPAARAEVAAPQEAAATSTTIDDLRRPDMANVPCPDQRDRRVGLTPTARGWVSLQADGTGSNSTILPFSIATLSGWMWSARSLFASYI